MLTWVDKYSRHAQVKCMCGKCCFTFNRLHVAGEQSRFTVSSVLMHMLTVGDQVLGTPARVYLHV